MFIIHHWWQPGVYWPVPVEAGNYSIAVLQEVFRSLGYSACDDGALESGFEKVAIYGAGSFYTHVARQLPTGKSTSKLGKTEDIEHEAPEDLIGPVYGDVQAFMRRPVAAR